MDYSCIACIGHILLNYNDYKLIINYENYCILLPYWYDLNIINNNFSSLGTNWGLAGFVVGWTKRSKNLRPLCLLPILHDHGIIMVIGPCGMQFSPRWKFPPHILLSLQGIHVCVLFSSSSMFSIFYRLYLHNDTCIALVWLQWRNNTKSVLPLLMYGNWKYMFYFFIQIHMSS